MSTGEALASTMARILIASGTWFIAFTLERIEKMLRRISARI